MVKKTSENYSHTISVSFVSYQELEEAVEFLNGLKCEVVIHHQEINKKVEPTPKPQSCTHVTEREKEVLLLLGKGFSYSESATFLGCSVSTIQTHIKRVYRKLQVNSKTEAIYEAIKMGLIDL